MHKETPRQLIHLSGLLFVLIAQYLSRTASMAMFFGIAIIFFLYAEHVTRSKKPIFGIRKIVYIFEKRDSGRPFAGVFWFYTGSGIVFSLLPLNIASAASAILAVGDSFSTMFGLNFGKHRLVGKKSLEGSSAFFVGAFFISLIFVTPVVAAVGAFVGMLVELFIPPKLGGKKSHWFLDDNLLIPIIGGAAMFVFLLL